MNRSLLRLFLLVSWLFVTCARDRVDPELVTMQIAERQQDCYGPFLTKCMLVKEGDAPSWQLFYGGIDGFTYEEGYTYELLARKSPVKNPPADGSSIHYELVKLNWKRKA